jgi:hypothetical protein
MAMERLEECENGCDDTHAVKAMIVKTAEAFISGLFG